MLLEKGFSLSFSMEKRSMKFPNMVVVLLVLALSVLSAHCLDRNRMMVITTKEHISGEPPPSSQFDPPNFKTRFRRIILSIALGIVTGLVFSLLFALLVRNFIRYITKTPIPRDLSIVFSPKVSPKILKSALANEPQLLGTSLSGKYYKAVLDNGLTVAVKRLDPFSSQDKAIKKKTQQALEALAGLRHRNLMSLRAYVRENTGGYSLVYDFVPLGSLEDAMKRVRETQLELNWESRLRIAVGIIKGLHYLHFTCEPRRLHYNLKPSNVMLDPEFEPRLADCGLATIIPNFHRAASGYNAPECFQNCRYTEKSDVYSFGVILGVLLTGKDPLDPLFGEAGNSGGSIGQWLRHLQQAGEAREALDKTILGQEMEENEMLMAVRIAVVCLSDLPADRPSSDELLSMLTQLNSF